MSQKCQTASLSPSTFLLCFVVKRPISTNDLSTMTSHTQRVKRADLFGHFMQTPFQSSFQSTPLLEIPPTCLWRRNHAFTPTFIYNNVGTRENTGVKYTIYLLDGFLCLLFFPRCFWAPTSLMLGDIYP